MTNPVSDKDVRKAFRNAFEEEDREKNLIIHEVNEETVERSSDNVSEIFEQPGEKPHIEACRFGIVMNDNSFRPVIEVHLSSCTALKQIISEIKRLKQRD